jgi:hypothetical protein
VPRPTGDAEDDIGGLVLDYMAARVTPASKGVGTSDPSVLRFLFASAGPDAPGQPAGAAADALRHVYTDRALPLARTAPAAAAAPAAADAYSSFYGGTPLGVRWVVDRILGVKVLDRVVSKAATVPEAAADEDALQPCVRRERAYRVQWRRPGLHPGRRVPLLKAPAPQQPQQQRAQLATGAQEPVLGPDGQPVRRRRGRPPTKHWAAADPAQADPTQADPTQADAQALTQAAEGAPEGTAAAAAVAAAEGVDEDMQPDAVPDAAPDALGDALGGDALGDEVMTIEPAAAAAAGAAAATAAADTDPSMAAVPSPAAEDAFVCWMFEGDLEALDAAHFRPALRGFLDQALANAEANAEAAAPGVATMSVRPKWPVQCRAEAVPAGSSTANEAAACASSSPSAASAASVSVRWVLMGLPADKRRFEAAEAAKQTGAANEAILLAAAEAAAAKAEENASAALAATGAKEFEQDPIAAASENVFCAAIGLSDAVSATDAPASASGNSKYTSTIEAVHASTGSQWTAMVSRSYEAAAPQPHTVADGSWVPPAPGVVFGGVLYPIAPANPAALEAVAGMSPPTGAEGTAALPPSTGAPLSLHHQMQRQQKERLTRFQQLQRMQQAREQRPPLPADAEAGVAAETAVYPAATAIDGDTPKDIPVVTEETEMDKDERQEAGTGVKGEDDTPSKPIRTKPETTAAAVAEVAVVADAVAADVEELDDGDAERAMAGEEAVDSDSPVKVEPVDQRIAKGNASPSPAAAVPATSNAASFASPFPALPGLDGLPLLTGDSAGFGLPSFAPVSASTPAPALPQTPAVALKVQPAWRHSVSASSAPASTLDMDEIMSSRASRDEFLVSDACKFNADPNLVLKWAVESARRARRMTQRDMATESSISNASVCQWINGKGGRSAIMTSRILHWVWKCGIPDVLQRIVVPFGAILKGIVGNEEVERVLQSIPAEERNGPAADVAVRAPVAASASTLAPAPMVAAAPVVAPPIGLHQRSHSTQAFASLPMPSMLPSLPMPSLPGAIQAVGTVSQAVVPPAAIQPVIGGPLRLTFPQPPVATGVAPAPSPYARLHNAGDPNAWTLVPHTALLPAMPISAESDDAASTQDGQQIIDEGWYSESEWEDRANEDEDGDLSFMSAPSSSPSSEAEPKRRALGISDVAMPTKRTGNTNKSSLFTDAAEPTDSDTIMSDTLALAIHADTESRLTVPALIAIEAGSSIIPETFKVQVISSTLSSASEVPEWLPTPHQTALALLTQAASDALPTAKFFAGRPCIISPCDLPELEIVATSPELKRTFATQNSVAVVERDPKPTGSGLDAVPLDVISKSREQESTVDSIKNTFATPLWQPDDLSVAPLYDPDPVSILVNGVDYGFPPYKIMKTLRLRRLPAASRHAPDRYKIIPPADAKDAVERMQCDTRNVAIDSAEGEETRNMAEVSSGDEARAATDLQTKEHAVEAIIDETAACAASVEQVFHDQHVSVLAGNETNADTTMMMESDTELRAAKTISSFASWDDPSIGQLALLLIDDIHILSTITSTFASRPNSIPVVTIPPLRMPSALQNDAAAVPRIIVAVGAALDENSLEFAIESLGLQNQMVSTVLILEENMRTSAQSLLAELARSALSSGSHFFSASGLPAILLAPEMARSAVLPIETLPTLTGLLKFSSSSECILNPWSNDLPQKIPDCIFDCVPEEGRTNSAMDLQLAQTIDNSIRISASAGSFSRFKARESMRLVQMKTLDPEWSKIKIPQEHTDDYRSFVEKKRNEMDDANAEAADSNVSGVVILLRATPVVAAVEDVIAEGSTPSAEGDAEAAMDETEMVRGYTIVSMEVRGPTADAPELPVHIQCRPSPQLWLQKVNRMRQRWTSFQAYRTRYFAACRKACENALWRDSAGYSYPARAYTSLFDWEKALHRKLSLARPDDAGALFCLVTSDLLHYLPGIPESVDVREWKDDPEYRDLSGEDGDNADDEPERDDDQGDKPASSAPGANTVERSGLPEVPTGGAVVFRKDIGAYSLKFYGRKPVKPFKVAERQALIAKWAAEMRERKLAVSIEEPEEAREDDNSAQTLAEQHLARSEQRLQRVSRGKLEPAVRQLLSILLEECETERSKAGALLQCLRLLNTILLWGAEHMLSRYGLPGTWTRTQYADLLELRREVMAGLQRQRLTIARIALARIRWVVGAFAVNDREVAAAIRLHRDMSNGSSGTGSDRRQTDSHASSTGICSLCLTDGATVICGGVCARKFHISCCGEDRQPKHPAASSKGKPVAPAWACIDCRSDAHPCGCCGKDGELPDFTALAEEFQSTAARSSPLVINLDKHTPTGQRMLKCSVRGCSTFLHLNCARGSPAVTWLPSFTLPLAAESEKDKHSQCEIVIPRFRCAAHICATCGCRGVDALNVTAGEIDDALQQLSQKCADTVVGFCAPRGGIPPMPQVLLQINATRSAATAAALVAARAAAPSVLLRCNQCNTAFHEHCRGDEPSCMQVLAAGCAQCTHHNGSFPTRSDHAAAVRRDAYRNKYTRLEEEGEFEASESTRLYREFEMSAVGTVEELDPAILMDAADAAGDAALLYFNKGPMPRGAGVVGKFSAVSGPFLDKAQAFTGCSKDLLHSAAAAWILQVAAAIQAEAIMPDGLVAPWTSMATGSLGGIQSNLLNFLSHSGFQEHALAAPRMLGAARDPATLFRIGTMLQDCMAQGSARFGDYFPAMLVGQAGPSSNAFSMTVPPFPLPMLPMPGMPFQLSVPAFAGPLDPNATIAEKVRSRSAHTQFQQQQQQIQQQMFEQQMQFQHQQQMEQQRFLQPEMVQMQQEHMQRLMEEQQRQEEQAQRQRAAEEARKLALAKEQAREAARKALPDPDTFDMSESLPAMTASLGASLSNFIDELAPGVEETLNSIDDDETEASWVISPMSSVLMTAQTVLKDRGVLSGSGSLKASAEARIAALKCDICRLHGEKVFTAADRSLRAPDEADASVTGPFFKHPVWLGAPGASKTAWVHAFCAAYSPEVVVTDVSASSKKGPITFHNIASAVKRGRTIKCYMCRLGGGTIGCYVTSCKDTGHLPCLASLNWDFRKHREYFCSRHAGGLQSLLKSRADARKFSAMRLQAMAADDAQRDPPYCWCGVADEGEEVSMMCDVCEEWYHPGCVGIPVERVEAIATWTCPRCTKAAVPPLPTSKMVLLADDEKKNLWKTVGPIASSTTEPSPQQQPSLAGKKRSRQAPADDENMQAGVAANEPIQAAAVENDEQEEQRAHWQKRRDFRVRAGANGDAEGRAADDLSLPAVDPDTGAEFIVHIRCESLGLSGIDPKAKSEPGVAEVVPPKRTIVHLKTKASASTNKPDGNAHRIMIHLRKGLQPCDRPPNSDLEVNPPGFAFDEDMPQYRIVDVRAPRGFFERSGEQFE